MAILPIVIVLTIATLNLNARASDDIKICNIDSGLLPYKVGSAKIAISQHSFLHSVNLHLLINQTIFLKQQLIPIKSKLPINYKSSTYQPLLELFDFAKFTIEAAAQNLENLKPIIRQKRSLINVVGKASKWLFGTLDNEDGEFYSKSIKNLQNNMQIIKTSYNHQLTLNKEVIQNFDKVLSKLNNNQNSIEKKINELTSIIHDLDETATYLRIHALINQIILHGQYLIRIIDNLENAIMFGKLNTLHTTIIDHKSLLEILDDL